MATYLFVWNPNQWPWDTFNADVAKLAKTGKLAEPWSSGNTTSIKSGSRAFLMRLGVPPKGLVAAGRATSDSYSREHWHPKKAAQGQRANFVDIEWNALTRTPIIALEELKTLFPGTRWTPQNSGNRIPPDVASALEKEWMRRAFGAITLPEEIDQRAKYREGAVKRITVNAYERNPQAREACILHYGPNCTACGMDFAEVYGRPAAGIIDVHHVVPLATLRTEYRIDPITDLIPLCPNCHRVIHYRHTAYSVSDLKRMLKKRKS